MLRRVSRWGVTALGVALVICGVAAMTGGWDIIQVERGWSLFIGGATALAGGAVVIALGQVVFRLDEILVAAQLRRAGEKSPAPSAPAAKPQPKEAEQRSRQPPPQAPPAPTPPLAPTPPVQQAPLAGRSRLPRPSSGEGAGARSRGARGRQGERRRASRGRPLRVRRHHLRDVLGRRGGSADIERRAALRFPRGASRASRAAILSGAQKSWRGFGAGHKASSMETGT